MRINYFSRKILLFLFLFVFIWSHVLNIEEEEIILAEKNRVNVQHPDVVIKIRIYGYRTQIEIDRDRILGNMLKF